MASLPPEAAGLIVHLGIEFDPGIRAYTDRAAVTVKVSDEVFILYDEEEKFPSQDLRTRILFLS